MDIALVWNPATFQADWEIDPSAGDLLADDGLKSAVIISLFTDRLAAPDDVLPDGGTDRRGWWGDLPADGSALTEGSDLIGSKLWLLARAKATPETALLAQSYCLEALDWMLTDGVAATVTVDAQWIAATILGLVIQISRYTAAGTLQSRQFEMQWDAALAA